MRWTSNRPTIPGFYWCRCCGVFSRKPYATVVKVYRHSATADFVVFWDGENFGIESDSFTEWSDTPIPEPT
jgi:hypothetical protein